MASGVFAHSPPTPLQTGVIHAQEGKKRLLATQTEDLALKRVNVDSADGVDETYCYECDLPFTRPYTFRRHVRDVHGYATVWTCEYDGCHKTFKRKDVLDRHTDTQHGSGKVKCTACSSFVRKDGFREHFLTKACRGARLRKVERTQLRQHPPECLSENKGPPRQGRSEIEETAQVQLDGHENEQENIAFVGMTMTDPHEAYPLIVIDNTGCDEKMHFEVASSAGAGSSQNESDAAAATTPDVARTLRSMSFDDPFTRTTCSPYIVADSPRPVVLDDTLSRLFLLDDTSLSEVAEEVERNRSTLEDAVTIAQNGGRDSKHRENGESIRRTAYTRRSHHMSFGQRCTLCRDRLGLDLQSVLCHAQSHIQSCNQPSLECSLCKIKFAHVVDLDLHQNKLQTCWLSQELPSVTVVDLDDWVAKAFAEAREAFISLLRSWESLQLHWYLAAVKMMVDLQGRQSSACRAGTMEIVRPLLDVGAPRAGTHPGHYQKHDHSMSELIQRLVEASIANPPKRSASDLDTNALGADNAFNQFRDWFKTLSKAANASFEYFQIILTQFEAMHKGDAIYTRVLEEMLLLASQKGYVEIARTLLDVGIDVNTPFEDGCNVLAYVIMSSGSHKMAELLMLRGAKLRQPPGERSGILQLAYQNGFVGFLREILRRGADVNSLDSRGDTVLAYTVGHGDLQTTKMLLHAGASPDPLFPGASFHPLGYAASNGLKEHVRLLLDYGAKIDRCDSLGTTALMKASLDGATDIVDLLLHRGADAAIRDSSGKLAVQFANGSRKSDILKLFQAATQRQHPL